MSGDAVEGYTALTAHCVLSRAILRHRGMRRRCEGLVLATHTSKKRKLEFLQLTADTRRKRARFPYSPLSFASYNSAPLSHPHRFAVF
jgi:hypothetical protein